jgi:hypothetical protein
MRLLTCLTLLLILNSCSDKKTISVDIAVDRLTIDNKQIDKGDFEENLKATIDSLVDSGLNKSMIDVRVTADRRISEYQMGEIEKAIRRQGVTRDYIWTDEKQ